MYVIELYKFRLTGRGDTPQCFCITLDVKYICLFLGQSIRNLQAFQVLQTVFLKVSCYCFVTVAYVVLNFFFAYPSIYSLPVYTCTVLVIGLHRI